MSCINSLGPSLYLPSTNECAGCIMTTTRSQACRSSTMPNSAPVWLPAPLLHYPAMQAVIQPGGICSEGSIFPSFPNLISTPSIFADQSAPHPRNPPNSSPDARATSTAMFRGLVLMPFIFTVAVLPHVCNSNLRLSPRQADGAVEKGAFLRRAYHSCKSINPA